MLKANCTSLRYFDGIPMRDEIVINYATNQFILDEMAYDREQMHILNMMGYTHV